MTEWIKYAILHQFEHLANEVSHFTGNAIDADDAQKPQTFRSLARSGRVSMDSLTKSFSRKITRRCGHIETPNGSFCRLETYTVLTCSPIFFVLLFAHDLDNIERICTLQDIYIFKKTMMTLKCDLFKRGMCRGEMGWQGVGGSRKSHWCPNSAVSDLTINWPGLAAQNVILVWRQCV